MGASDAQHLLSALQHGLVLITWNHDDILDLYEVVQAAHGTHHGLLITRFDNNPARNMTPRQMVRALATLEAAGGPG